MAATGTGTDSARRSPAFLSAIPHDRTRRFATASIHRSSPAVRGAQSTSSHLGQSTARISTGRTPARPISTTFTGCSGTQQPHSRVTDPARARQPVSRSSTAEFFARARSPQCTSSASSAVHFSRPDAACPTGPANGHAHAAIEKTEPHLEHLHVQPRAAFPRRVSWSRRLDVP